MIDETSQALFKREAEFLAVAKAERPELFKRSAGEESAEQLRKIGIVLPNPLRPRGYLRFSALDFIVEEIRQDGTVLSTEYIPKDPGLLPGEGDTLYADLVKVNLSTLDAAREIARALDLPLENISYAGIKDAVAVTSQTIAIKGVDPDKVRALSLPNLFLKQLRRGKGVLQPGMLSGNRFTITVRTEEPIAQTDLEMKVARAEDKGFWNFYWLQRFGNRLRSHEYGRRVLLGDYEGALRAEICEAGEREILYIANLRRAAFERWGNWQALIDMFQKLPYTFRFELIALEHLLQQPHDFIGALHAISDQTRIWVYAYASYCFNRVLSSYAASPKGFPVPKEMPLLISPIREDRALYESVLREGQLHPRFLENLKPFPFIRLAPRKVPTKIAAEIRHVVSHPVGALFEFDLGKGSYATTFLSHFFVLIGGEPVPSWVATDELDAKAVLQDGSLKSVREALGHYLEKREIEGQEEE